MKPLPVRPPRAVTWLAMSLSLGYLALMATLMWLFEHASALDDLGKLFDNPRLVRSWVVIGLTSLGVFLVAYWALARMSGSQRGSSQLPAASITDASTEPVARPWGSAVAFLAMLAAMLLGTGSYIVTEQEAALDAARFRQFAIIGQSKSLAVARWVDERQRDLRVLLDNPSFADDLQRWARQSQDLKAASDDKEHNALHANINAVLDANGFDGMTLVDPLGQPMFSLPDGLLARAQCRQAAADERGTAEPPPRLSFAFADESGQPKMDVIGSVYLGQAGRRERIATLCMRIDLGQRLLPLVSHWPGVARSGEVLLSRVDGQDIVWLNSRAKPDAPWRAQRLAGAGPLWADTAAQTAAGRLHQRVDGGGRQKLMSVYAIKGTPWQLMVRMDRQESEQLQMRQQMRGTVLIGFVLIFVAAAFAVAWARSSYSRGSIHAQRDALLQRLREMAYYDELTGLPGRRLIHDRLGVALQDAARRGEQAGLLFIDLDRFKAINDQHGHAAGDAMLKATAQRMQQCLRKNDSAGRLSGDEFLAVLPACGGAAALASLSHKLSAALSQPLPWQGQQLAVGVSIGSAIYPDDAADMTALLAHADAAMYRNKRATN